MATTSSNTTIRRGLRKRGTNVGVVGATVLLLLLLTGLETQQILSPSLLTGGGGTTTVATTSGSGETSGGTSPTEAKYPLDTDGLHKYHVNVKDGLRKDTPGQRWRKMGGTFYDCPTDVKQRYSPTENLKKSVHYHSQEEEDTYMYRHFFHTTDTAKEPDKSTSNQHYFIELGALDGVTFSNTYFYEAELDWGGLLIEGETLNYVKLEQNRRGKGVTTAHVAICTQEQFIRMRGTGPEAADAASRGAANSGNRISTVPCLPISGIVRMAQLPQVDFFSIDVEGAELAVIESFDFRAVPVHTMLIEQRPADEDLDYQNAKVRRALYARGFCRYDNSVGHNNEVWVNPHWQVE